MQTDSVCISPRQPDLSRIRVLRDRRTRGAETAPLLGTKVKNVRSTVAREEAVWRRQIVQWEDGLVFLAPLDAAMR